MTADDNEEDKESAITTQSLTIHKATITLYKKAFRTIASTQKRQRYPGTYLFLVRRKFFEECSTNNTLVGGCCYKFATLECFLFLRSDLKLIFARTLLGNPITGIHVRQFSL